MLFIMISRKDLPFFRDTVKQMEMEQEQEVQMIGARVLIDNHVIFSETGPPDAAGNSLVEGNIFYIL